MRRLILTGVLVTASAFFGGFAVAQTTSSRVTFARFRTPTTSTVFRGLADRFAGGAGKTTYDGNVVITFPDAQMLIKADKATWDRGNVLTFDGLVRIELDAK